MPECVRFHQHLHFLRDSRGFSLLEIAIVMVIVGLLAGGGISLMGMLAKRKARNETVDYLNQARAALISYASIHGRLPWADTSGNGSENVGAASGNIPYQTLKLTPADSYRRVLKYALNSNLGTDLPTSCSALRSGLSGGPNVVDGAGAATPVAIAAVLVSAGNMDADGDGNVFDDITSGTHQGDNTDGNPNYVRHPPLTTFDDLVVYFGENELYGEICEYLALAVNNNFGATVYVYNRTQGADIGSLSDKSSGGFDIMSGTQIEIHSLPGGVGGVVISNPPTPIVLAGQGCTLNIPPP